MAWFRWIILCFLLLSLPAYPRLAFAQESITQDHVKVTLVAPDRLERGDSILAFRFEVEPHWHVYWKNPGDSGTAPRFAFTGEHATVSDVMWPVPKRIPVSDFVNIGYEGEVLFPFSIRPSDTAQEIQVKVELEWLVCKEECLPGSGEMSFTRPIGDQAQWDPTRKALLEKHVSALPKTEADSPWSLKAMSLPEPNRVLLQLTHKEGKSLKGVEIFPVDGSAYKPKAPQLK